MSSSAVPSHRESDKRFAHGGARNGSIPINAASPDLGAYQDQVELPQERERCERTTEKEVSKSSENQTNCQATEDESKGEISWASFWRGLRRSCIHFTPSWFSVNMGTGITAILIHQLPWKVDGLWYISTCIFVLNVVLFFIFLAMSTARYLVWPRVFQIMIAHPSQSLFLGTFPMGFATIVNLTVFIAEPVWGSRIATLTEAMWWIDVFFVLLIGIGVPYVMFEKHNHSIQGLTAAWLLPIVAAVVAAASGGVVSSVLPPERARTVVIASYVILGLGLPPAFLVMSLYFLRLAVHNIVPSEQIVSVFLPLGPCGQGAFGILQLSTVVRKLAYVDARPLLGKAGHTSLIPITAEQGRVMADAIYGSSVALALVVWGLGAFWLIIAVLSILRMIQKGGFPFNMGWWGFTFPLGVFTSATASLGNELDSDFFKVLACIFTACVTALWALVAVRTTWSAFQGRMFFAPCLSPFGGQPPRKDDDNQQA